MDADLVRALETIKNSGALQSSKIKNLETKIETLTSCLTDSEATNQILKKQLLQKKEETRILTLKLQQQADIIEAVNTNIENFHAANVALLQGFSQDGNRANVAEKGSFVMLNTTSELTRNDDVVSQFKNLTSRLTSENFEKSAPLINKLPFYTFELMKNCVEVLFEAALSEPKNMTIHVELCRLLSTRYVCLESAGEITIYFKNLLAMQCLNEFEELVRELQSGENHASHHVRAILTVRFVGNLYNSGVLTFKSMFHYLNPLSSTDNEHLLECLCELLTLIGKQMELERRNCLSLFFVKLSEKLASDTNSPTIRKMIQEAIDFRQNYWRDRKKDATKSGLATVGINFEYNADQWRPDFQEGRKYYTSYQLKVLSKAPAALQKPDGLPDIVLADEKHRMPIYSYEWKGTLAMANAFHNLLRVLDSNNFDQVTSQALDFEIADCNGARKCVTRLLVQAVSKPELCELYAKFAEKICAGKDNFQKLLVYTCRELAVYKSTTHDSSLETDAEIPKYLQKPLHLMQFIMELFKLELLPVDILNDYVDNLLKSSDPADLIFLCELLAKNGRQIELTNPATLNDYFVNLNAIASDKKTSKPVKFAIQDLFFIRQNDWPTNTF